MYFGYILFLSVRKQGKKRDDLIEYLRQSQVASRPLFFPMPDMPFYAAGDHFPAAQKISEQGISLPSGSALTAEQIHYHHRIDQAIFS